MKNPKTPEQLEREIGYYVTQLSRTRSPDRIRRAHVAIRVRERQLQRARALAVRHPASLEVRVYEDKG